MLYVDDVGHWTTCIFCPSFMANRHYCGRDCQPQLFGNSFSFDCDSDGDVPTKKVSTAFYSSTSHIMSHSAKPELSSVAPTSSANSEHTTMFQTASQPMYTLHFCGFNVHGQEVNGSGPRISPKTQISCVQYKHCTHTVPQRHYMTKWPPQSCGIQSVNIFLWLM